MQQVVEQGIGVPPLVAKGAEGVVGLVHVVVADVVVQAHPGDDVIAVAEMVQRIVPQAAPGGRGHAGRRKAIAQYMAGLQARRDLPVHPQLQNGGSLAVPRQKQGEAAVLPCGLL